MTRAKEGGKQTACKVKIEDADVRSLGRTRDNVERLERQVSIIHSS
jgi:hypothetical protein